MDTTKRYIEMSEKARELREEWEPEKGDWVFIKSHKRTGIIVGIINTEKGVYYGISDIKNRVFTKDNMIPLWRQDQLQKTIDYTNPKPNIWNTVNFLTGKLWKFIQEKRVRFNSFEQLWLAYVMWKKYGKVWDEERKEWVKKEEA